MSKTIRPLRDRIVVRRNEPETKLKSGIVLPGTAAEKPLEGEVLAVGTGTVLNDGNVIPVSLAVGDRILFAPQSGQEVQIDGESFLIMHEHEIIAVLEA